MFVCIKCSIISAIRNKTQIICGLGRGKLTGQEREIQKPRHRTVRIKLEAPAGFRFLPDAVQAPGKGRRGQSRKGERRQRLRERGTRFPVRPHRPAAPGFPFIPRRLQVAAARWPPPRSPPGTAAHSPVREQDLATPRAAEATARSRGEARRGAAAGAGERRRGGGPGGRRRPGASLCSRAEQSRRGL